MNTTFRTTIEDEHGVIREAECEAGRAMWSVKSPRKGTDVCRTDDNTTIFMRVPKELLRPLIRELDSQATALEDSGMYCGERS